MAAKTNPGPGKSIKNDMNSGIPTDTAQYQQVGIVNYNDKMHQFTEPVSPQLEGPTTFKSDVRMATDMPKITSVPANKLGK